MKKKQSGNKKLVLQRESIRMLRTVLDEALADVVGGGPVGRPHADNRPFTPTDFC